HPPGEGPRRRYLRQARHHLRQERYLRQPLLARTGNREFLICSLFPAPCFTRRGHLSGSTSLKAWEVWMRSGALLERSSKRRFQGISLITCLLWRIFRSPSSLGLPCATPLIMHVMDSPGLHSGRSQETVWEPASQTPLPLARTKLRVLGI